MTQIHSGPAGESDGVLARYNFRNKAIKHLPVLDANIEKVTKGPVSVVIHPTNACNAKCPMCRYADLRGANENIPLDTLLNIIRELGETGTKTVILSGGGEPIIYNGIDRVIKLAASYGIKLGMVTNFIRVSDALLDIIVNNLSWIRISVNAATADAYKIAQGMDEKVFDMLINNIKRLVVKKKRLGSNIIIGCSFIVQKGNYKEVGEFLDLCTELGVDYAMYRPVQRWSPTASISASSLALTKGEIYEMKDIIDKKLSEPKEFVPNNLDKVPDLFFVIDAQKDYPKCLSSLVEAAIGGDGNVYPCCQHVGNTMFSYGNVLDRSFKDIWFGDDATKVRDTIKPSMCPPCRYNFYNTVFNKYVGGWRPSEKEIIESFNTPDADFL